LTLDGEREWLNVDFVLSPESFEAYKYNWKTKNIHVKSRIILIRVKSRLYPFHSYQPPRKEYRNHDEHT